jgi:hypothetical protein
MRAPVVGKAAGRAFVGPLRQVEQLCQTNLNRKISGRPDVGTPFGKSR